MPWISSSDSLISLNIFQLPAITVFRIVIFCKCEWNSGPLASRFLRWTERLTQRLGHRLSEDLLVKRMRDGQDGPTGMLNDFGGNVADIDTTQPRSPVR